MIGLVIAHRLSWSCSPKMEACAMNFFAYDLSDAPDQPECAEPWGARSV
jgi:hypothetical protein